MTILYFNKNIGRKGLYTDGFQKVNSLVYFIHWKIRKHLKSKSLEHEVVKNSVPSLKKNVKKPNIVVQTCSIFYPSMGFMKAIHEISKIDEYH